MKMFLLAASMLISFQSFAGSITLMDKNTYSYPYNHTISTKFDLSKNSMELGRAWVTINFEPHYSDDSLGESHRVAVPGLSFDAASSSIVLNAEGKQIVCATVKVRRVFGIDIKETGDCTFSEKRYTVMVDDGFEVKKVAKKAILLNY